MAMMLALIMIFPNIALASDTNYIYVPEIQIEDGIKDSNLFYLASSDIEMTENEDGHYLVKVARGGEIDSEASVTVKMSDVTAKYGKDYKVYLYNGGLFNEADNDSNAQSVIEMIEDKSYETFEIGNNEDLLQDMEDNSISGSAVAAEIGKELNNAVAENKDAKGENADDYIEAASSVEIIEAEAFNNEKATETTTEAVEASADDATPDINTLAGAKEAFTGIKSDRVEPKTSMDIIDQFEQLKAYQDVADTISDAMTGATLEINFKSGESEKYIEIVPIDNDESDSTRIFNVTIGDPTGEYTVSAYSTAVAQITDNEEKVRAKVSFATSNFVSDSGSDNVSVTLVRDGGINDIVSVTLKSKSGTAMSGRDFSPVNAEVVFPFGITERTVEIPVNKEYITEDSVFGLYIDTPVSCDIGDLSETEVSLSPENTSSNNEISQLSLQSDDNEISLFMNDTTRQNNARVYFPRAYTNNDATRYIEKSGNFKESSYGEGEFGWYIRPTDGRKWSRAEFGVNNEAIKARYDVNGMTFSYKGDYAAHPHDGTARAGFRITRYNANGSERGENDWQYTGGSTGWTEKTIYTNEGNVRGVQVYAEDDKGSGRDLRAHFSDIYPIKRQFKITLESADKMYLRTVSGNSTKLTEVTPTAYISNKMTKSLGIDGADTNTLAYRTSGETLSITVGNNNYFKFKGLYAVNSTNPKEMIKIADANGNNTCTFTLDNNLLKNLIHRSNADSYDYVTLSNRTGGGKYGNITIKPVFEYIDQKVYVERNTQFENKMSELAYDALGYLSVNGTDYVLNNDFNVEIKPDDSLGKTFHKGDEYIVKTNAETDLAKAAGVGYRIGVNTDTMDKTRTDKRNSGACYTFNRADSGDVLKNNVLAFYPIYTEKENGLTVMVRKSDVDNNIIDTSYGILSNFFNDNVKKIVDTRLENGQNVEYYRFLASTDVNVDEYYQYSARATDGYAIKWIDSRTGTVYSGNNMLYKPTGLSQDDNILVISAENQNVFYGRFKGNLKYNVYDVSTGFSSDFTMPLSNGAVTISGVGAISDDKGNFETSECGMYIDGTHIIKRVAVDNTFSYVDITLNKNNPKLVTSGVETFNTEIIKKNVTYTEVVSKTEKVWEVVCRTYEHTEGYYRFAVLSGSLDAEYDYVETSGNGEFTIKTYYGMKEYPTYETKVVEKAVTETVNKTDTVYLINTGNCTVECVNEGAGISEINVYEGDSTYACRGVIDINDSEYVFRANVREADDEHIKALKFAIVDPVTKKTKHIIPAQYEESSGQWIAKEKMNIAMTGSYTKGDTLYAYVSTDKNVSGQAGALKEYMPVYSGYDFIQGDSAYDTYAPQNFNLPTNGNFVSLPMLNKLATGFNFPFVSIALEQRPTGEYRVKIGANVTDIVNTATSTGLTPKDDAGMGYTDGIDWKHPVNQLKSRASFAYTSIFKNGLKDTPLLNGTTTRLGPTQFKVSVVVGGYIDFGQIETTINGTKVKDWIVSGGGGYIGVSLSFKKAFYFLICGTVPAYIGGSASGTLIGNMGATRKSNSAVALSSMKNNELELDDALAFNGNLNASMSVALFAGVGLCDVLGVRLEGDVDLSLLWEPLAKQTYAMNDELDTDDYSNSKIHEVGFTVAFSLGGKVDLLLFTIPVMYSFEPINSGFNKDIQNAHVRKTATKPTVDIDGSDVPTGTVGTIADGWYYVKNVSSNTYLQSNGTSLSMGSLTANDDSKVRFYISTGDKYSTIATNDNYSTDSAKYVMMETASDMSSNNHTNRETKLSSPSKADSLNAYGNFIIKDINVNDFNIISAAEGEEMYLMLDGYNNIIFDKTGTSNSQLWRLEAVDEPVTNGWYQLKSNNKYLTDVNGNAELAESKTDGSQTWYVSQSDNYITLQNAKTNNYLYVDSNSGNNGINISVKANDNSNAVHFDTTKLTDGSYYITTRYSLGSKYLTTYVNSSNVVTNSLNDTYNQKWSFVATENPVSSNDTTAQATLLSSDGVSLFSADNDNSDIAEVTYNDENAYSDENVYLRKRTTGDSQWTANANDGISLYSGFTASDETTLVENSYERPDSQVVDLGNGDYMLLFIDTDSSRGELERTVLKYAFYRNGSWSEPSVIQADTTADFQPNAMIAGDNVAVTWISSEPDAEKTGDATQYLTTMEVYTTLIDKNTGAVGEITRLTNDSYYDYSPTVIYDDVTGDMAVYYIKSSTGSSFIDTANSFTNDCIITYMLYDNKLGKWLTDYYYPEEVSDEDTAAELIKNWGGQRFLPSPIDELNMSDPLITDFTAISYNGLAVYGYTIDKDNDSSTNDDRDLFIQVYDFTTHKNHKPIRITNDAQESGSEIADTMPQFVRAGGSNASTYLYWFRGDHKLSNINVSDFAHNGLNNDGTVSDSYDLAPSDVYINLPPKMKQGSNEAYASMSYYKVCVDSKDNIYVIWVDLDRETNKQEIFATAVITDEETNTTSYADAYQLTHSGKHNDEPAFLVDDKGNMVVISTRYDSVSTGRASEPLEITNTELVATIFAPYGELYAENITLDNTMPDGNETVNVSADIYNRGLTVAEGYSVTFYEMKGTQKVRQLDTITSSDKINAGEFVQVIYDWTVSGNVDGTSIGIEVTEGGMSNTSFAQSDELKYSPDITLDGVSVIQKDNDFYLHFVAENKGNEATDEKDNINLVYYEEKAPASMLGIENQEFVKTSIAGIQPGESKEFEIQLENLNGEIFNAYGYIPVLAVVTDGSGNFISNDEISYAIMDKPIDIKVNNTKQIVLNAGEAVDLSITYAPAERYNDVTANYSTDNISIATVIDNQLVGVSAGVTKLVANIEPYGSSTEIEVVVNGSSSNETTEITTESVTETTTKASKPSSGHGVSIISNKDITTEATTNGDNEETTVDTVETNDAFTDIAQHWGRDVINSVADKGIINGYKDKTFKPNNSITRAEFMAMLYNSSLADTTVGSEDIKFADVSGDEWYCDYINWGASNNLIVGYEDNTFRGNNIISREEMAVVISKFIALTDIELEKSEPVVFNDSEDIAPWAKEYVDNISAYSIVKGDTNNCYMPKKDLSRAETAVIISELIK